MDNILLHIFNRVGKALCPGLGVKRWLLLIIAGIILVTWGSVLILGPGNLAQIASHLFVLQLIVSWQGMEHGIIILLAGLALVIFGFRQVMRAVSAPFLPWAEKKPMEVLFNRRYLGRGPKIVAIGGGTGLSNLLRGLKEYTSNITAIVTVTDDGGSSGRLRGELGILPPGDIRACLLALAETEPLMERLFEHRFRRGESLGGHSFGNLFIAAMTDMLGFEAALKEFSKVLAVRGRVLPVTLDEVRLLAEDDQGNTIYGESNISCMQNPVSNLSLDPPDCRPLPEVLQAIRKADVIVMGPGSLLTSVLPNLLVSPVAQAVRESRALKYYVCNIMTQPGETDGFSAADHLEMLRHYAGEGITDYIVLNTERYIPRHLRDRYREEGADIVEADFARLHNMGIKTVSAPLMSREQLVRHHPQRLARLIMEIFFKEGIRNGNILENSLFQINDRIKLRH